MLKRTGWLLNPVFYHINPGLRQLTRDICWNINIFFLFTHRFERPLFSKKTYHKTKYTAMLFWLSCKSSRMPKLSENLFGNHRTLVSNISFIFWLYDFPYPKLFWDLDCLAFLKNFATHCFVRENSNE